MHVPTWAYGREIYIRVHAYTRVVSVVHATLMRLFAISQWHISVMHSDIVYNIILTVRYPMQGFVRASS